MSSEENENTDESGDAKSVEEKETVAVEDVAAEENAAGEQTSPDDIISFTAENAAGEQTSPKEENLDAVTDEILLSGFDINYDPNYETYTVHDWAAKNRELIITEDDLNYKKYKKGYAAEQAEKFKDKVEIYQDTLCTTDLLNEENSYLGYYDYNNAITINSLDVDKENDKKLIKEKLAENGGDISDTNVQSILDKNSKIFNDPEARISTYEHEYSHYSDDKSNSFRGDLSPEYMAKMDMMTEIKANMTQAGRALWVYKQSGSMEGFDNIPNCDMTEVKKQLAENPDMKNPEKFVAKSVYDGWLEKNNVEGSAYSQQACRNAENSAYFAAAQLSNAGKKDYNNRVSDMFSNVKYLGDVSDCVSPDFELNKGVKDELKEFFAGENGRLGRVASVMAGDAKTAKTANRRMKKLFNEVKKADEDGVRTPQEQMKIDSMVLKYLRTAIDNYNRNEAQQPQTAAQNAATQNVAANDGRTASVSNYNILQAKSGRTGR